MTTNADATPERWRGGTADLPTLLEHLRTVVLAVMDMEGRLIVANRGFSRLVGVADADRGTDVTHVFVNPAFERLVDAANAAPHATTEPVFRGLITLGRPDGIGTSVRGDVYRRDGAIVLVAEHDIAELEALAQQMIGITEQMADTHRELVRTKKQLEHREEELERLVATDPLTGVSNRRHFDERLTEELARSRRTGAPLSLVMLDLDRFKPFNDRWGHVAGDACLKGVASILRANSRPYDTAARYGGEEFILILPGTDATAAQERADALRESIARMEVPGADDCVTASFGVAEYRDGTAEDAIREVDGALYDAKRAGKNCVRIAGA